MKDNKSFQIRALSVANLDNARLAWAVIAPLWDAVDFERGYRLVASILASATSGQRYLFALDWCQKEVRNGGFEQYFSNSTGMLAPEALEGLQIIGAEKYATLVAAAMTIFPKGDYPRVKSKRLKVIKAMLPSKREEFLKPLDDQFFDLLKSDDLENYRANYIRENPDQFFDS